ncbi:MAG: branched-chain amino acid ABC transporter permease [Acidimicrobiia bacterium]
MPDPDLEQLGRDDWVARHEQRAAPLSGLLGTAGRAVGRVPYWARVALLALAGVLVPLLTENQYFLRVAGTVALMATLALGLNLVAGYAGLLDLGFVAFYGIGGYAYAYLSSDFTGLHLPSWASLALITVLGAMFGLLLGSPSLRLVGDYLAIVTLGFGLVFVQLATSLTRVTLPWSDEPRDLTGGPNGIVNLDPITLFGFTAGSVRDYYLLLLGLLLLAMTLVHHVDTSRVGRGWRALREDELAAETMGMPTRHLKLLAFSIGAAIAGVSGAVFAAWQGSVFPSNFDVPLLITLYAIVVLGGLGSLPGVLFGALVLVVVPELLRDVELAGALFYPTVLVTLLAALRPRWKATAALGALALLAGVGRAAAALAPEAFSALSGGSGVGALVRPWLVVPGEPTLAGNLAFLAVLVLLFATPYLRHPLGRLALLVPGLYLLALAWEIRLSEEPSITRLILVGAILVALMNFRPNGLFGRQRVEVV